MHPAVKFFQRFQAGLLADIISSLVWTLAGDQQCTSKLPEKCRDLCEVLVEEKEAQISSSLQDTSPSGRSCLP